MCPAICTRILDWSMNFYLDASGMLLVSRSKTPIGEFAVLRMNHTLVINYYTDTRPEATLWKGE